MSLRRRLVVGMLGLLVAAVVATDVVTYSSLKSFLVGRLDEQIDLAQSQAYRYIDRAYVLDVQAGVPLSRPDQQQAWLDQLAGQSIGSCSGPSGPAPTGPTTTPPTTTPTGATARRPLSAVVLADRLNPDVYAEVIDARGQVVFRDPSGSCAPPDPAPRLPAQLPVQAHPSLRQFGGTGGPFVPDRPSFDTGSSPGGTNYRAQAIALPGGTLVTAIALTPTNQTLANLIHVELVVTAAVLLGATVLGLIVVRFGLRPLGDMTVTAGAIAAGDLTRRVRRADEKTEVGRLGRALNGMLSQIEAAFRERTESELRLRRFVADASHELRTPLTSIRGYAELLRKGAVADEEGRQRAAERIEGEAARMGRLVDDLLLLARLDQGRPIQMAPVDLGRLVEVAVEDSRAAYPEREITADCAPGVVVDGDADRLRQVVDNLVGNAAVHTPAGTSIGVSVSGHGGWAVLRVSDQGPGLDAEQRGRVFDRFYRGSAARSGAGAGLGLSIVAALAQAHGGTASVESAPGRGTTFLVEVPSVGTGHPVGAATAAPTPEDHAPAPVPR